MHVWLVADLLAFARLLVRAGNRFVARRTLQRLEADEITPREAIEVLAKHGHVSCESRGATDYTDECSS